MYLLICFVLTFYVISDFSLHFRSSLCIQGVGVAWFFSHTFISRVNNGMYTQICDFTIPTTMSNIRSSIKQVQYFESNHLWWYFSDRDYLPSCTSSLCIQQLCEVITISVNLIRRSCAYKTMDRRMDGWTENRTNAWFLYNKLWKKMCFSRGKCLSITLDAVTLLHYTMCRR